MKYSLHYIKNNRSDRRGFMKDVNHDKFLYYLIPLIITLIITSVGYFYIGGIPLVGVPKIKDVLYVEIYNNRLGVNSRKLTEIEDIEKVINLTSLLSYKLGTPEKKAPLIEFVFHLKDGNSFSISSNEKTVYKNGKAYSLKDDKGQFFIKVTEGVFFFSELIKEVHAK